MRWLYLLRATQSGDTLVLILAYVLSNPYVPLPMDTTLAYLAFAELVAENVALYGYAIIQTLRRL